MQNNKAQVLMLVLWILVILTILAVSIGHRVSLALRLSRYQSDRIKAYGLARAGIQRAIAELENDNKDYDSLDEAWSTGIDLTTNTPLFENIEIVEGSGQMFTVNSLYDKDTYLPIVDEEHKININTASKELLMALLKEQDFEEEDAQALTNDILFWRAGEPQIDEVYYENFKKKPFIVPEELILILENFYQNKGSEDYQNKAQGTFAKVKYLITVYPYSGTFQVNINTASENILTILANSVANQEEQQFVDGLITNITNFRKGDSGPFKEESALDKFYDGLTETQEKNIFSRMKPLLTIKSEYFAIWSTGTTGKVVKKITAIYDRQNEKIIHWYEN